VRDVLRAMRFCGGAGDSDVTVVAFGGQPLLCAQRGERARAERREAEIRAEHRVVVVVVGERKKTEGEGVKADGPGPTASETGPPGIRVACRGPWAVVFPVFIFSKNQNPLHAVWLIAVVRLEPQ
jgi:hypothetical protein